MELIIIDDVSSDETPRIIKELINDKHFSDKFTKGVSFIQHAKNMGAHYSLNEGLKKGKCDYLTVINTDDVYEPERINAFFKQCDEREYFFAFGAINVVDENDHPVNYGYGKAIMKYQDVIKKCPLVSMALSRGNSAISTGNMFFSRKLFEKLDGFGNYKYIHDWDFALRAALLTEPVFVSDAIYNYRVHTSNTIAEISHDDKNPDSLEKPVNGQTIGKNPLISFFEHIIRGEYSNDKIPALDVWNYFMEYKKYYYDDDASLWAWKEAKKNVDSR